jgi:hypothetical protein
MSLQATFFAAMSVKLVDRVEQNKMSSKLYSAVLVIFIFPPAVARYLNSVWLILKFTPGSWDLRCLIHKNVCEDLETFCLGGLE